MAAASLPVPGSPAIRIGPRPRFIAPMRASTSFIAAEFAMIGPGPSPDSRAPPRASSSRMALSMAIAALAATRLNSARFSSLNRSGLTWVSTYSAPRSLPRLISGQQTAALIDCATTLRAFMKRSSPAVCRTMTDIRCSSAYWTIV